MNAKIKIYKLRQHNRWVAARVGGNIFVMGHTWANVVWQLRLYANTGKV